MAFFEIAREGGMVVQEVGREMAAKVMFGEDEGVSRSSAGVSTRVVDAEWKVGRGVFFGCWCGKWRGFEGWCVIKGEFGLTVSVLWF